MDIIELGTKLLSENMGQNIDTNTLSSALTKLLGDSQGNIDLAGLAGKMASNGELGNIVSSWLGDGANSAISADSITSLLGQSDIADFAAKLGTDSGTAAGGLAEMLPQMMDKASSGGSLLDSLGGVEGLLGAANSLFK